MSGSLDAFIRSTRPAPVPVAVSQEIRDRGSTFLGSVYRASDPEEAKRAVSHVRDVVHAARRATHEISAWRCMVLKVGKTGLGGEDEFELRAGCDDDGEKYAGEYVLTMKAEAVMDAVVIVTRWYGGELLGPARFNHIETCTREVCKVFRQKEEMEECITTLASLDDILATLREELLEVSSSPGLASATSGDGDQGPQPTQVAPLVGKKKADYTPLRDSLDLKKAKRLVTARENSIRAVKASLKKARETNGEKSIP